ncbi:MAG: hypothetical protein IJ630_12990 [Treponema sp.]|nr:hypothetical protein [Treponema sp.]
MHILESSQEAKQEGKARGHCESKARSNASTVRPVAPGTAGKKMEQSSSPLLPLCVLPVSARRAKALQGDAVYTPPVFPALQEFSVNEE